MSPVPVPDHCHDLSEWWMWAQISWLQEEYIHDLVTLACPLWLIFFLCELIMSEGEHYFQVLCWIKQQMFLTNVLIYSTFMCVSSSFRDDAFSDNLSQKADSEASSGPLLDDKGSSKNDAPSPCEPSPDYNFGGVMGR